MKEKVIKEKLELLPIEELKEGCTYFSNEKDLMKILHLYSENEELYMLNISKQYHIMLPFKRHGLVRLIQ